MMNQVVFQAVKRMTFHELYFVIILIFNFQDVQDNLRSSRSVKCPFPAVSLSAYHMH